MTSITSMSISVNDSGKIIIDIPKKSSDHVDKSCIERKSRISLLRKFHDKNVYKIGTMNISQESLIAPKWNNLITNTSFEDATLNFNTKLLYTCIIDSCENNFVSQLDLKNHQAKNHSIFQYRTSNVRVETTVEDAFPISDSDRRLINRKKRENAIKLACEMCGQMTRKDWMVRHLRNVHRMPMNEERKKLRSFPKVKCPKCNKMLSTGILHRHMVAVHKIRSAKLTMVSCHLCHREMTSSKLWSHVKFGCQERKIKDPAYCDNDQKKPKTVVKATINMEQELTETREWIKKFRAKLDQTRADIDEVRRKSGKCKFEFIDYFGGSSDGFSVVSDDDSSVHDSYLEIKPTEKIDDFDDETNSVDYIRGLSDEITKLKRRPAKSDDYLYLKPDIVFEEVELLSKRGNPFLKEEIVQSLVLEVTESNKSYNGEHEAAFSCSKCSYTSFAKSNMVRHIGRVHNKAKPFACKLCGKVFVNMKSLERHIRKIHKLKLMQEECDTCLRRFKTLKLLLEHKKMCVENHQIKYTLLLRNQHSMSKEELRKAKVEYFTQTLGNGPLAANGALRKFNGLTQPIPISKNTKQAIGRRKGELALKMACDVCGIQVRKDWMKRHLVNVHRIGNQKKQIHIYPKVECPNCRKKVSTVGLARHMSKVHQLRGALELLVPCHVCGEQVQCTTMDYHVRTNCGSAKHITKILQSEDGQKSFGDITIGAFEANKTEVLDCQTGLITSQL